jgi:NADH-quinone oxidoreductase subunit A
MATKSAIWLFSKETYSNVRPAIPTFLSLANPTKYNNKEYGFSNLSEDTFFNVGFDFFIEYCNFLNKNIDLYEKNSKNYFKKYLNNVHQSNLLEYSKLYSEIFFKNYKNSYLKLNEKYDNLEKIKKYKVIKSRFTTNNQQTVFSEYSVAYKNLKIGNYFDLNNYIKKFNDMYGIKNNFVGYVFNYFQTNQKNNIKLNIMISEFIQQGTYSVKETNSTISFILYYFIVLVLLALILFSLSKLLSKKEYSSEKKSPYECGFEPFMLLITSIEISFILVAFVFLIFDLELVFLIGFLIAFGTIGTRGLFYLMSYCLTV